MSREIEQIRIIDNSNAACSKMGRDTFRGEPISDVDIELYREALSELGGVSEADARRVCDQIKEQYAKGTRKIRRGIELTIGAAVDGLISKARPQREPLSTPSLNTEIVIAKPQREGLAIPVTANESLVFVGTGRK